MLNSKKLFVYYIIGFIPFVIRQLVVVVFFAMYMYKISKKVQKDSKGVIGAFV